ncbi:MAG: hypothetical protein HWD90_10375 [Campylobacteraceae bacterium]|nr:hypothetical protein [Campylobacteraceae bacterium]
MFSEIIDFSNCCEDNKKIDFLYNIFKIDFIDNNVYLNETIFIDPKTYDKNDGKEKIFWHVITKKDRGQRKFDSQRASRIKWIKTIILNYSNIKIKMFYYYEDTRKIRLYLWAYDNDFVVILQKLGNSSSYLVTSFYIDNQKKKDKFQNKYEDYINKVDSRLNNCEWF